MEFTFACGRCTHRFSVVDTATATSIACPECGSTHCYGAAVPPPPADPAPSSDESASGASTTAREQGTSSLAENRSQESTVAEMGNDLLPAERPAASIAAPSPSDRRRTRGARLLVAAILGLVLIGTAAYGLWRYPGQGDEAPVGDTPQAATNGPEETEAAEDESERVASRVAGSLEEAKQAIVKFVMPLGIGDLTQHGTGFLVDRRGWVATNNHVIARVTKEARVKLADGRELELEGIVARAPRQDLAIVQLKQPPPDLTLLDIGYGEDVPLGEEVFAFGHPYGAEFSLSKGIVSRVLTSKQCSGGSRQHLLSRLRAPDEMLWIQHDAKISPGNSGGPLIDQQGRVYGLNTFLHRKAEFGYASHVKYLRELTGSAPDQLEPLPEARKTLQTQVSSRRIVDLFADVSAFGWQPQNSEQYAEAAELAKQMTLAKHALLAGNRTEQKSDVIRRVAQAADQRFAALRDVPWSSRRFRALNAFADEQLDRAGEGIVAYGSVLGNVRDQDALLLKVDGTDALMVLRVSSKLSRIPRNTKCLVLGFVLPQVLQVENRGRPLDRQARVVLTQYMLFVRTRSGNTE